MKKAGFVVVVIVLLLIINSLLHSIYDLWHKQDLVVLAQKELDKEELKNQKLKGELSYAQSSQFIEEAAHNKLFLVKPGEQSVLISQELLGVNSKKSAQDNLPNWKKWINLFF